MRNPRRGGPFLNGDPGEIVAPRIGALLARYLLDMHDTVVCGIDGPGAHPAYRSIVLAGRNLFDALPRHTRVPMREAVDKARSEQVIVTTDVPSGPKPEVVRIVRCVPGRRTGDVKVTVFAQRPPVITLDATNN